MERTHIADPARRPRNSCKVVMSTPALEHAVFVLKQQAVTLTAADGRRTSSPMAVGQALEAQLRIPPHQLRITCHDPDDYLILFNLPVHQQQVVKLGSITVDGAKLFIRRWHEDDHAVIQTFNHHVRVVIEKMPQHFWSVEGAEEALGCRVDQLDSRTYERSHTKSFACWVWVWDVALIPTKHTFWRMQRGAGRVEEMLGLSPPGRAVAAPPTVSRHDVLIHMDRIEDWTPYAPWSPRSPQSGLPSSDSDDDDMPMPRITPATWKKGVEDGQREPQQRRQLATLADMGCRGGTRGGGNRKEDDGDDQGGAGPGRTCSLAAATPGRRRRQSRRSPRVAVVARRRGSATLRARGAATTPAAATLRAMGPVYTRPQGPCPHRRTPLLTPSSTPSPISSPAPRTSSRSLTRSTAWPPSWRPTWQRRSRCP